MNNMNRFLMQTTCIFMLLLFAGCNEYLDKEVERLIYVNHTSLNMTVGDEIQLTASPTIETYTWESMDTSVATVSKTGEVWAMGEGETQIVVSCGDLRKEISVYVTQ